MPDNRTQPKLLGSLSVAAGSKADLVPSYDRPSSVIVNSRRDLYLHVMVSITGAGTDTVSIDKYHVNPDAVGVDADWGLNGTLAVAYAGTTYSRIFTVVAAGQDCGFTVLGTNVGPPSQTLNANVNVEIKVLGSSDV